LEKNRRLGPLLLGLVLFTSPQALARDGIKSTTDWINSLDVPDQHKEAIETLEAMGRSAYPYIIARYKNEESPITGRGYCLTLLAKSPDHNVQNAVWEVASETTSPLMKLWSQAALVNLAKSPNDLLLLLDAEFAQGHGDPDNVQTLLPVSAELQRPIALKLVEWAPRLTLEEQLRFLAIAQSSAQASNVSPTIAAVITPGLKSAQINDLVDLMFHSDGQQVRRLSAALLAGFQGDKRKAVFSSVMEELRIRGSATDVPWAGGALFLPQFGNMNRSEAQELIAALTRWSVWTQQHKTDAAQTRPLENNLRSYSLWAAAGGGRDWRTARGGRAWLQAYGKLMGAEAVRSLLEEQNVPKTSTLWSVATVVDALEPQRTTPRPSQRR